MAVFADFSTRVGCLASAARFERAFFGLEGAMSGVDIASVCACVRVVHSVLECSQISLAERPALSSSQRLRRCSKKPRSYVRPTRKQFRSSKRASERDYTRLERIVLTEYRDVCSALESVARTDRSACLLVQQLPVRPGSAFSEPTATAVGDSAPVQQGQGEAESERADRSVLLRLAQPPKDGLPAPGGSAPTRKAVLEQDHRQLVSMAGACVVRFANA